MNLQINLSNTTYENICGDKLLLSDIPELIQAIKSGEPVETMDIPDISKISIGYQIEIPIDGKVFKATAIKEESNGGHVVCF